MALDPTKIEFILNQMKGIHIQTFRGVISQMFKYLEDNIKDNQIYDKYLSDIEKWAHWPAYNNKQVVYYSWVMPDNLEDAQSLAFALYNRVINLTDSESKYMLMAMYNQDENEMNILKFNSSFLGYFENVIHEIVVANPEVNVFSPKKIKSSRIFIIHGHDEIIKTELKLLLNIAGVNSIILHEQIDGGRIILDKFIQEAETAGYAIAILTPDDILHNGINRTRQNVIFEIGYFLGKLGKDRLRMIVKDNIEIPSDLSGVLYEKYENEKWKIRILLELRAVGIHVDLDAVANHL